MIRWYIECYSPDGQQILGNLDGQAALKAKNYKRTHAYRRLKDIVGNPKWMECKVGFARIVTPDGTIVETVKPATPLLQLFECNWSGGSGWTGGTAIVLADDAAEAKAICERETELITDSEHWSWQTQADDGPTALPKIRYVLGMKGIVYYTCHRE